jgi:hypothetical protein
LHIGLPADMQTRPEDIPAEIHRLQESEPGKRRSR